MGNKTSKIKIKKNDPEIPPDSPLGRMLASWGEQGMTCTKGKSKEKMIQYCYYEWPKQPILSPSFWWPKFGSDEDWVCQYLNVYVNTKIPVKSEESNYAACWLVATRMFTIQEKGTKEDELSPSWNCLDGLPPSYQVANAAVNPPPLIPPPPILETPPIYPDLNQSQPSESQPSTRTPSETLPVESGAIKKTRVTEVELEKDVKNFPFKNTPPSDEPADAGVVMCPLREVPMAGGVIGFVNVPLTSTEVRNFKKEMKSLLEDPLTLAEQLDQFLGPNIYTWDEMQAILGTLLTPEERQMVRQAGMRIWERENPPVGGVAIAGEVKYPIVRPDWDQQTAAGRQEMIDFRKLIIKGIRESVPRGQNFEKAFENRQEKDEAPAMFLQRLRRNVQQYSGINPETDAGQQILRANFVTKSWPDIKKKLEKLEDWNDKSMNDLLKEAQKVYVRREDEKQKGKAKIMMQAVEQVVEKKWTRETSARGRGWQRGQRGRGRGNYTERRGKNRQGNWETGPMKCYYCNEEGHFKRECPKRQKEEKVYAMMEEDD